MGAWGPGLYSNDFASDLRSSMRTLLRLPYEPEKILELLCEMEGNAANNPQDEDHTTFWLVVADQFSRKGLYLKDLSKKAITIIDEKQDVHMLAELGMEKADLKKREKVLQKIKDSLCNQTHASAKRKILKAPQPFIMEVGDCFSFPTCNHVALNPYVSSKERENFNQTYRWEQDGFGLLVIVEKGRVLDYFTWYRALVIKSSLIEPPSLSELLVQKKWSLLKPGVFTKTMAKNSIFERLGKIQLDEKKINQIFSNRQNPYYRVVEDISMGFGCESANDYDPNYEGCSLEALDLIR